MWKIARQPRWIAALVLALGVAVAFVLLSQWQIERGIEQATVIESDTETVVPLTEVAEPQGPVTTASLGQRVTVRGVWVAADFSVIENRLHDGESGFWLTGHLLTEDDASLAVALGWAPTEEEALAAVPTNLGGQDLEGRYISSEGVTNADYEESLRETMAVPALINEWSVAPRSVYGGYLALAEAGDGLATIAADKPEPTVELNWLNIFYAIEWVVFAGFAVYFWFRLVKDAWEREQDEAAEAAQLESTHGAGT